MMFALIESPQRVESARVTLVRTALHFAFRTGADSDLTGRIAALEAASGENARPCLPAATRAKPR